MTDENTRQLILAAVVLLNVVQSFLNGRKLNRVHNDVNGKMEKLIEVSVDKAHAEGVKEEKERL